jgi:hypothetical protein
VDFFYYLPSRLEDLDGHGLLADKALQLLDLLLELADPPRSTRRIQFRTTLGEMPSSRESSARVFSPDVIRATVSRLNATEKTRRPSAFRGNSTMTANLSEPILGSKSV